MPPDTRSVRSHTTKVTPRVIVISRRGKRASRPATSWTDLEMTGLIELAVPRSLVSPSSPG